MKDLSQIAKKMVAPKKGILAADESFPTIEKRFAKIGISSTEENRQAYRQMLLTSEGYEQFISGVILFGETLRQKTDDGIPFAKILEKKGVLPGIKVDQGAAAMDGSSYEKVTQGLEGLPARLKEYAELGAKFTKWRAVYKIGDNLPTDKNILQNAKDLAQFAKNSQKAGLVPIVEPEVLMDGSHDINSCVEVTEKVLTAVFSELKKANVDLDGIILKSNMALPGKDFVSKATPAEIAKKTVELFKKVVPKDVPGIVFLSGGQSEKEATINLNEMNKIKDFPWELSFSYGRALQDTAMNIWAGKKENIAPAQQKFLNRAKMNSLARSGSYSEDLEE
ncbi:MAG: fructose-bisphosphate aldolase class I [Candidatus Doudnabacteria bacterium CG10_big_fil_rev_8_21_14_0_10_41_10]|uniref:Probable fructose-bisphosphate aldolase class 1 n=1 Tax=Candidatus Doudnabacteria bacterium CG10_big_fil_rev_8_21_14_0_10_41_10 TaxID=1974551 RepID=A0A2H0VCU8_9BACT|nr:MAG: fructose-bisphosphate aldolase class I [Candidatus Doudnabacteria bacterium CG10_big_fil_rev_8_21_14_0_10_41_10]